ncbi:ParB/RepB/Spo0J family partition protein [Burkholderia singularis]|uniref:Putative chromosome partitioning protein n=1 Tax=Burkholderia singularis TaxID=1503053 RepID=A0A238H555_9BURK|nr:hypothetical protein [Burkholderia singularis]SMG00354.1 putative chromosome partitioning protein [Burkholderia singularis]
MAKNSIDAYGAIGKSNVLNFDPEDLVLITDPNHALFDRRALMPFDEATVLNIMAEGVTQSITITKDVETGKTIVVDGRRRVINAREANRRLVAMGLQPWRVPALPRRDGLAALTSIMVSANEIRRADSPINRAEKMARMRQQGRTNEEIGRSFGIKPESVDGQLRILDCCEAVRIAVESDEITATHALRLAKLPPERQREKVRALIAAAEGKKGHERSRAQKAALTGDAAPRMRTRKQIAAELANATGERAEALRWVLNLDGETPTVDAADSRQMSIDEAV